MRIRPITLFAALLSAAALIAGLSGCGSVNSLGIGANATSQVRVFNALVSGPASGVDIVQRNAPLNLGGPLIFGQAQPSIPIIINGQSSYYYSVVAGIGVNTSVYATGTTSVPLAPAQAFNLDPNTPGTSNGTFTIAVAGIVGQPAGSAQAPQLLRFIDQLPALSLGTTNVFLRVINLAPDTQGINIYNNGGPITGLSSIAYGASSNYQSAYYVSVPAGQYNLSVYDNAHNQIATITNLSAVSFQGGHAYTLFAIGEEHPTSGAPPFDLKVVQDR